MAATVELFPVNGAELADLIRHASRPLDIAFGTGGAALRWDTSQPMPWYIERLGLLRGVLNENTNGAGI